MDANTHTIMFKGAMVEHEGDNGVVLRFMDCKPISVEHMAILHVLFPTQIDKVHTLLDVELVVKRIAH